MNSPILQLLVLAGIAVFLILRLKSVLGTRDGFEPSRSDAPTAGPTEKRRPEFEVIDGGPDHDIEDHVDRDSKAAKALAEMKRVEPDFSVTQFLQGARGAYEMILMAFENGKLDEVMPFLSEDVYEAFAQVVDARQEKGLSIQAEFIGLRETSLSDATFDATTNSAEISVKFIGELISVVRDSEDNIVEGKPGQAKKQKDIWTFEREMSAGDPNWRLVATGE
jgi:predicted lipid-binding transport protein (Tim44 family)